MNYLLITILFLFPFITSTGVAETIFLDNLHGSSTPRLITEPTVTTEPATEIGSRSAQLNGIANPMGLSTMVWFEWGISPSFTEVTTTQLIGSGNIDIEFFETLSGLSPNTDYIFRAVAENSEGRVFGSTLTFTTTMPIPPFVSSIDPEEGPKEGGTDVIISGDNFTEEGATLTQVLFGSNYAANVLVVDDNTITCTTPPGNGTVIVQVINNNGASNTDVTFTYEAVDTTKYFSLTPDDIIWAVDNKERLEKSVKRKADKVEFCLFVVNKTGQAVEGLHIEFSHKILQDNIYSPQLDYPEMGENPHKWIFTGSVAPDETVYVCGIGDKGKLQRVPKWWWIVDDAPSGGIQKRVTFTLNQPRLPMPNAHNLGEEIFGSNQPNQFPQGLKIGLGGKHSVVHKKYKDVLKSLANHKKEIYHEDPPRCLDVFDNNQRPINREQKNLPPTKHNNELFALAIVLKINITASDANKTPWGFGDLIYNDGSNNPLNGLTVRQISARLDTFMTQCNGLIWDPPVFADDFASTISDINSAFSGELDTISFATKLILKGIISIEDVDFLHPNSSTTFTPPLEMKYENQQPELVELYQNYPNPFNPMTVIGFHLPVTSLVTLKVYNILGQEVAKLLDKELMENGFEEVEFDAGTLPSGVYFYQLISQPIDQDEEGVINTGKEIRTKRMLLVK